MVQQSVRIEGAGQSPSTAEKQSDDERSTVWAFVWTLFFFKIATLLATFWAAAGSVDAAILMLKTNWFWVGLPMFAIWAPVAFHYRLRRVRRRRAVMMRSEWMLE